jgi:hypothetical protein
LFLPILKSLFNDAGFIRDKGTTMNMQDYVIASFAIFDGVKDALIM